MAERTTPTEYMANKPLVEQYDVLVVGTGYICICVFARCSVATTFSNLSEALKLFSNMFLLDILAFN
jgi:hypothetical protein